MENQGAKNSSKRLSSAELDQVSVDFALATALQEQESSFTILETIQSDSESDQSSHDDNYEYSFEFEGEDLEFLERQESENEEEMEEDDIDPDELSYEELIALGEIIGVEERGLSLTEISSHLHPLLFWCSENKSGIDRCVVCQVEYEEGEKLVGLCCNHLYHLECISKWLGMKKTCPICTIEVSSSTNI